MPLSTNKQLWKIMIVIFAVLSAIFSLCFYFKDIFITLILGITVALITEKFIETYSRSSPKYREARWRKRVYGYLISFFWFGAIIFLIWNSISDLSNTLDKYTTTKQTISISTSLLKLNPYLPSVGGTHLISKTTAVAIENYLGIQFGSLLSDLSFIVLNALFVVPIVLYMYFRKKNKIADAIMKSVPHRFTEATRRAAKDISRQLGDFFSAKIIQSLVIGTIACLGFFIAGVKGWLIFES
jgi:predicted PurR-regulated permease PerM